jgi:hypothetical protein
MKNYLEMKITYETQTSKSEIYGDLNKKGQQEILEAYLRNQIGKGEDNSKPEIKEKYTLKFQWFSENDQIIVKSDTGNKSLEAGIIMQIYNQLF